MDHQLGAVRVSAGVLATLVRLTAAGVPGVARVGSTGTGPFRWVPSWRNSRSGVHVRVQPDGVYVELDLVVQQGNNLLEVAGRVQKQVGEAIDKMAGLTVREVNVQVLDVQ